MQPPQQPSDDQPPYGVVRDATDDGATVAWLEEAACGSLPLHQLEQFFVKAGQTIGERTLALCRSCRVRSQCLEHALRHDIMNGYFGGVSPSARRADGRTQVREGDGADGDDESGAL